MQRHVLSPRANTCTYAVARLHMHTMSLAAIIVAAVGRGLRRWLCTCTAHMRGRAGRASPAAASLAGQPPRPPQGRQPQRLLPGAAVEVDAHVLEGQGDVHQEPALGDLAAHDAGVRPHAERDALPRGLLAEPGARVGPVDVEVAAAVRALADDHVLLDLDVREGGVQGREEVLPVVAPRVRGADAPRAVPDHVVRPEARLVGGVPEVLLQRGPPHRLGSRGGPGVHHRAQRGRHPVHGPGRHVAVHGHRRGG
mmetsp:Transcript_121083/g.343055  ORF Transcript_121083/g.343055 Transcript_121083/m.343055 type:complete len:253 (+) Transcript_121083:253-1011(+)